MPAGPRPIESGDLDWVLALNRAHETELSPLTRLRLEELVDVAFYAKALDPQAAFLLAFDQGAGTLTTEYRLGAGDWVTYPLEDGGSAAPALQPGALDQLHQVRGIVLRERRARGGEKTIPARRSSPPPPYWPPA